MRKFFRSKGRRVRGSYRKGRRIRRIFISRGGTRL